TSSWDTPANNPLLLHKLVDAPVAEVRRIDGSRAVDGYLMWSINLAGNLAKRPQYAQNLAVQIHLDDARIIAVAHVKNIFAPHVVQSLRHTKIRPLAQKLALLIEDLHALVHAVGHIQAPPAVNGNIVHQREFAIAGPFRAPLAQVFA